MELTALKKDFAGEISTAPEDIKKFSEDASIFHIVPSLVVRPKDAKDVQALVRYVAKAKPRNKDLSLTARSAGTDMSGGPLTHSIAVDFLAHFTRILDIGKGFASAEPGVYYRDFEKETLKMNRIVPSYPASRELCTLGGMVNNNSGGEKSLSYGKTENYVEELNVVLSDGSECAFRELNPKELAAKKRLKTLEGEIYRKMYALLDTNYNAIQAAKPNVSKNSAGYYLWNVWDKEKRTFNLNKVIVGAQGTLGLITKIKFRLVEVNPCSELLVMFLPTLDPLGGIVDALMPYKPESFESYDDNTFKLAMKFFPDLLRRMKGNLIKLGLQFIPELWLTLTGGVPKLVLIAEFTGKTEEEVAKKIDEVKAMVENRFHIKCHRTKNRQETMKYWVMRRESFNLLREHVQGKHTAPFIDDIVVRPHDLPEFLPRLNALLEPYKNLIIYTIAGHAGDGNFHIIPLMDFKDPKERALILSLSDKVYSLVAEFRGSITGEHNDGLIRTPYLNKMYSPKILELFAETKKIFDPQNIFNPGKKTGAVSPKEILRYMKED